MLLSVRTGDATGLGRRLAAIALLGGIAALHGLTILAACAAAVAPAHVPTAPATSGLQAVAAVPATAMVRGSHAAAPVQGPVQGPVQRPAKGPMQGPAPRIRLAQASPASWLAAWSDADDDDRDHDSDHDRRSWRSVEPIPGGTYRTMCVRLCDGYYFPISFATGRDRFAKDARVCASRCGGGRLFVYRNPGGEPEDMADLTGQAYRRLPTAFLYRTTYIADCKCQPHPWEAAARQRHQAYAAAEAAARAKAARRRHATRVGRSDAVPDTRTARRDRRRRAAFAAVASPETDSRAAEAMRLTGTPDRGGAPRPRATPPGGRDSDWRRRAFQGF